MNTRLLVATMWNGPLTLKRLAPDDPEPTQAQLDQWATALTAGNDGVRPVVRVVERATIPRGVGSSGAAGSMPR